MRGFSTLEMMIAIAILAIVLSGVVLADFSAQYWTITSRTSNEALYKAKVRLENLRASTKKDFLSGASSALTRDVDADCAAGGLCYFLQTTVTDLSRCSKYAEADVSWQTTGYPTSTASLFTTFSNAAEAIALGGDCSLDYPSGGWTSLSQPVDPRTLAGTPNDIDEMSDTSYIAEGQNPSLEIATSYDISQLYPYSSPDNAAFNALDVARDLVTGRTYAYVAATSTQFRVIDVTSPQNPLLVASSTLAGVPAGLDAGWAIAFYDRKVYIATRQLNSGSAPEFHIFDVGYPTSPTEVGSGYKLNTSVYGIAVRDQYVDGVLHRFAYLATTASGRQLTVLDVTDPHSISQAAACSLAGPASALWLLGNTLYLGLNVASSLNDLQAFDATNPLSVSFCNPLGSINVDSGGYSRHAVSLRASGPYLFVATNNTTPSRGELQVRHSDPSTGFSLITSYLIPTQGPIFGMDFDSDYGRAYLVSGTQGNARLQVLGSTP